MSLGRVIGGAVVALIAPVIFIEAYEFLLMIIVASVVVSIKHFKLVLNRHNVTHVMLIAVGGLLMTGVVPQSSDQDYRAILWVYAISILLLSLIYKVKSLNNIMRIMGVWALVTGLAVAEGSSTANSSNIFIDRSFFGISRVTTEQNDTDTVHTFIHGDTIHNIQLRGTDNESFPLSYHARQGSFG